MTLWLIVGEAVERWGNSSFERTEGTLMAERFMQLVSQRTQLMPRVVL